ncbi:ultraviolet-B receptor UVR8 [Tanacetum coccineum]|uniref:Ultraviolet-B receptor UVR8 n=1 Tax=Tanacetum coccineum TaxID=301880 RepID=A0ABQ5HP42_9ASTR
MGRCGVWGKGDGGRLGFGDEETVFRPRVNEGLGVRRLAFGELHSVAVDSLGDVYSWSVVFIACSFMLCDLDFEPLSLSLSSLPSCDLVSLTQHAHTFALS